MKEIWELAISGQVLPFTLLLIPVALYWLLAALGTLDLDFLNIDFDHDVDVDANADVDVDAGDVSAASGHGPALSTLHGVLKAVNATDVPIMIVMSILIVMMWICAGVGNMIFNPGGGNLLGTLIGIGSLVAGMVLTRLVTNPLKPMFRAMKGIGTENRPVVGRSGTVRTNDLTDRSGQVEIEEKGDVVLLNARLTEGASPLKRGDAVIVYHYDKDTGIYYVKDLSIS